MDPGSVVEKIRSSVERFIVGYRDLIKLMIVALASSGHILVEGPPGLGKTTLAKVFARSIDAEFRRIQMTPDILPSDIIGSYYYDLASSKWILRKGPIFTNILLVDELNRAPPRTQSALLEAMAEGQVSIEGTTHQLSRPFLVVATQLPHPSEGTYPLTPVQRDRFSYSYRVEVPSPELEAKIIDAADMIEASDIEPAVSLKDVSMLYDASRRIHVSDKIKKYVVDLVSWIRRDDRVADPPSPRASIWSVRGARALALMEGLDYVAPDHVKEVFPYVMRHRISIKPEYQAEGVDPEKVVGDALDSVEVPKT